jgi:hypothetical protein
MESLDVLLGHLRMAEAPWDSGASGRSSIDRLVGCDRRRLH